jgi:cobalt-zinc-cadmium efflux system protein
VADGHAHGQVSDDQASDGHAHQEDLQDRRDRPVADGEAGHGQAGHGRAGHSHGVSANANVRYLAVALGLIVAFMIVEVVVALVSGSLVLLADAGHMLTDVGAIAVSLWAIRLAARPATAVWTFGLKRAEILSAAGNGITLLVVAALITLEAVRRLIHPPGVAGGAVLTVALVGVVVNVAATWVLAKANRSSLNVEGAFQHILTDLYAFIGTAIAGVIILVTGYTRADAIASLLVAALMLRAAWGLLRDSGRVLLEAAPAHVSLTEVRDHMLELPEVSAVHDLHAWTVTSDQPALSAHVVIAETCFSNGNAPQVLDRLQQCLTGHFDVEHSTFQLEPAGHQVHETGAHP